MHALLTFSICTHACFNLWNINRNRGPSGLLLLGGLSGLVGLISFIPRRIYILTLPNLKVGCPLILYVVPCKYLYLISARSISSFLYLYLLLDFGQWDLSSMDFLTCTLEHVLHYKLNLIYIHNMSLEPLSWPLYVLSLVRLEC